jgi:hypothetical protein
LHGDAKGKGTRRRQDFASATEVVVGNSVGRKPRNGEVFHFGTSDDHELSIGRHCHAVYNLEIDEADLCVPARTERRVQRSSRIEPYQAKVRVERTRDDDLVSLKDDRPCVLRDIVVAEGQLAVAVEGLVGRAVLLEAHDAPVGLVGACIGTLHFTSDDNLGVRLHGDGVGDVPATIQVAHHEPPVSERRVECQSRSEPGNREIQLICTRFEGATRDEYPVVERDGDGVSEGIPIHEYDRHVLDRLEPVPAAPLDVELAVLPSSQQQTTLAIDGHRIDLEAEVRDLSAAPEPAQCGVDIAWIGENRRRARQEQEGCNPQQTTRAPDWRGHQTISSRPAAIVVRNRGEWIGNFSPVSQRSDDPIYVASRR